jgi:transposase
MKYAPIQVLPDVPAGGVFAGVDWAVADHVACVVDMAGRVLDRFSAYHDLAGIEMLIARLRRSGVTEVAIERGGGVLVEALLAAGLTVVVVSSHRVKNLRARYRSGGGKDDRFDSFVLADTLRTDRARLRPLVPDTPATLALRAAVRARRDLVAHRVAACNQLRAHLAVAFPAAVGLFFDLASPISLRFLASFGSQDAAADLDEQAIGAWLKTIPERGKTAPASALCAAQPPDNPVNLRQRRLRSSGFQGRIDIARLESTATPAWQGPQLRCWPLSSSRWCRRRARGAGLRGRYGARIPRSCA